jgi:hypothetical protein
LTGYSISDGVSLGYIDLYNPKHIYQEIWNTGTLANTTHTLKIVATGGKNPASSGEVAGFCWTARETS